MRRRTPSTASIPSPRTPPVTCADAKEYWLQFCSVTPIHGVRYIVDSERPLYERVFWAVVLAVCLYFASAYSKELWLRLTVRSTDFSTQTTNKYDDLANIPVPAITFCDQLISTETEPSDFIGYVCGQEGLEFLTENVTIDMNHFIETSALFNVTCLMNHFYSREMEEGYSTNCEKMFTRVITQYGVCYTMNMLDKSQIYKEGVESFQSPHGRKSDWDPDKGYIEGALIADPNGTSDPYNEGPYPKRATSYETEFLIRPGKDGSFCIDDDGGVRVALHSPIETPRIGHRNNVWLSIKDEERKPTDYIYLAVGMEYQIDVYPEVISTDIGLKLFPPDQRRCYYPGEKTLAYFQYYSETNCESECLINATMVNCSCYDFYMPHWENTKSCSNVDFYCIIDMIEWWKKSGKRECACYPSCKDLKYNTEIYFKKTTSAKGYQNDTITLTISMASDTYILKEIRRVQSPYFLVDFVANCGGVFGLFCGLSIVSIVELAYYGTVRLATNFFRRKRKKEADKL